MRFHGHADALTDSPKEPSAKTYSIPPFQNSLHLRSSPQLEVGETRFSNQRCRSFTSTDIAQCPQTTVLPENAGIRLLVAGLAKTTAFGLLFVLRNLKPFHSSS